MWNKPRLLNAIADLLILSAAAAALAVALVWLVRVPSLPLRQVVFAQELQHTRRAEIEQSLPAVLKGNFFSLDLEAVRGELEKLPWIRKVELRRIWPARLEVKVEEHRPAARWGEGRDELVNTFGEVFVAAAPDEDLSGLPLLHGPQGTAPEVLKRYGDFVGNFKALDQKPVPAGYGARGTQALRGFCRKFQGAGPEAGAGHAVPAAGVAIEAGQRNARRNGARAAEITGGYAFATVYRGLPGAGRQARDAAIGGGFTVSERICDASRGRWEGKVGL